MSSYVDFMAVSVVCCADGSHVRCDLSCDKDDVAVQLLLHRQQKTVTFNQTVFHNSQNRHD